MHIKVSYYWKSFAISFNPHTFLKPNTRWSLEKRWGVSKEGIEMDKSKARKLHDWKKDKRKRTLLWTFSLNATQEHIMKPKILDVTQ